VKEERKALIDYRLEQADESLDYFWSIKNFDREFSRWLHPRRSRKGKGG